MVRASVIAERLFKRSLCYNTDSYVEASRVLREWDSLETEIGSLSVESVISVEGMCSLRSKAVEIKQTCLCLGSIV